MRESWIGGHFSGGLDMRYIVRALAALVLSVWLPTHAFAIIFSYPVAQIGDQVFGSFNIDPKAPLDPMQQLMSPGISPRKSSRMAKISILPN